MIKLCPRCKGKLWPEPILLVGDNGEYGYSDNIAQHGLDIRCDKGHRFHLTGADYQEYLEKKRKGQA